MSETLEQVAKDFGDVYYGEYTDITSHMAYAFKEGVKWQQERSYSEEEVLNILNKFETFKKENKIFCSISTKGIIFEKDKWFEQFKKI